MSVRYVLAPQATLDLVEIGRYIKNQASLAIADRVESAIREKIAFLAGTPGAGHSRKDSGRCLFLKGTRCRVTGKDGRASRRARRPGDSTAMAG